jgi:K+-transporting ATPase ATPase B chain
MSQNNKSLFPREIVMEALKQSFVKLRPASMFRNPVMFTVYIVTIVMFFVCIWIGAGEKSQGSLTYNVVIFLFFL